MSNDEVEISDAECEIALDFFNDLEKLMTIAADRISVKKLVWIVSCEMAYNCFCNFDDLEAYSFLSDATESGKKAFLTRNQPEKN